MTTSRLLSAIREARPAWLRWRRFALVALGVGTFLAFLGPFGTDRFGWPLVWLYWAGTMLIGWTIASLIMGAIVRVLPARWPAWAHVVAIALALTPPMSVFVIALLMLIGFPASLTAAARVVFDVFILSLAMSAIGLAFERGWVRGARAPGAPPSGADAALLRDRLPHRLKDAAILAIASEDHYLRVHTERGDELILMRLSDAMKAVAHLEGMQVHRSWWVARAAIADVDRADGKLTLRLANGVEVPVSRSFAPSLREAGWA